MALILVICRDRFSGYFWRRFSLFLMPRYLLQYPSTLPSPPMPVCITVIGPSNTRPPVVNFILCRDAACEAVYAMLH